MTEETREGVPRLPCERQFRGWRIYLCTSRRTRHILIGPLGLAAIAILTVSALGWSGFTTARFVSGAASGYGATVALEGQREAYEARLALMTERQRALETELNEANARREAATGRLGETQRALIGTQHRLNEAETELAGLRAALEVADAGAVAARDEISRLSGRLLALRVELAEAEARRDELGRTIGHVGEAADDVIVERDFAVARNEALSTRIAALEIELVRLEDRKDAVFAQLQSATEIGLSGLERLFSRAEIDVDRIIDEIAADYSGSGGPFEPFDAAAYDGGEDVKLAALMEGLERVNLMRFAAERLPFARPVMGGRFTSGFGPRRDPLRRRVAMHNGIDIAGPRGTPVLATADGIVTFAGRQRGYGNVIEIRHAFGFQTVYAHLDRVGVTVGQQVQRGDRIGGMGSTGRSTGIHLHYEVRIDNEAVNPMKFIEAARDVL